MASFGHALGCIPSMTAHSTSCCKRRHHLLDLRFMQLHLHSDLSDRRGVEHRELLQGVLVTAAVADLLLNRVPLLNACLVAEPCAKRCRVSV